MRRLLTRYFAPCHFGAAIGRFRHREHVRPAHYRAEKANKAHDRQRAHGSGHDPLNNARFDPNQSVLFDFDRLV
jgi:hypothetical protein